jgi:methylated-DNA-[protein]-cysteine S-methyltransferase
MPITCLNTPLGKVGIVEEDDAITRFAWGLDAEGGETALLARARDQLSAYFAGELTRFDLPLRITGSNFQRAVCAAMAAIPFGETRTYGDIARELDAPAQAVGQACGANPIPVIIPCHRVLGANTLGGFSAPGGIEAKVWLLRHEGAAGLLI